MCRAAVHMPPLDGRLIQLWLYGRSHPDDNHYAHPIDAVVLVDLNLKKVGQQPTPPLIQSFFRYQRGCLEQ